MPERLGGDAAAEAFARKRAASNPASRLQGCSEVPLWVEQVCGQRKTPFLLPLAWAQCRQDPHVLQSTYSQGTGRERRSRLYPGHPNTPLAQVRGVSPFLHVA